MYIIILHTRERVESGVEVVGVEYVRWLYVRRRIEKFEYTLHSFCVIVCDKLSYRVLRSPHSLISQYRRSLLYIWNFFTFFIHIMILFMWLRFTSFLISMNSFKFSIEFYKIASPYVLCLFAARASIFVDHNRPTIHS